MTLPIEPGPDSATGHAWSRDDTEETSRYGGLVCIRCDLRSNDPVRYLDGKMLTVADHACMKFPFLANRLIERGRQRGVAAEKERVRKVLSL